MPDYWLIRAGRNGELWDQWKDNEIITIGWDIGNIAKSEPSWGKMKQQIFDEYSPNDPGGTTGMVRRVAGIRDLESDNIKNGDIAVVEGNATVAGVAKIGEYQYEPSGLDGIPSHTYWRKVEYLHSGPVRIRDLPQRFQQGQENSLQLPSSIKKYSSADENVIEELLRALDEAEEVTQTNEFIDFSEASLQGYLENNIEQLLSGVNDFTREYSNRAGDADFVCEMESGEIVVIETKVGTAKHDAVAQLQSYMNAIRDERDIDVRGLLVAEDFSNKARLATPSDHIELIKFEATPTFEKLSA